MEYNELYDESPYVSEEIPRRRNKMTIIRATGLFCATILASVAAMLFYGYQQEQYVISASGQFVSIFDRKHQTINVCDKTDCRLLLPQFAPKIMEPQMSTFSSPVVPANQMPSPGRMPGVFNPAPSLPGMTGNPQMMNQGNAPGMPPMGSPQMMGQSMPQGMAQNMQQGMPQGGNPQMMRSPIAYNGQMGPGGPMMANNQFPPRPYMMQPQMMGGMPLAPLPPPPAPPAAPQDDSAGNAQSDDSANDTASDDTTSTDETSTDEAPSEEAAPV
jgi:hypothetical protein